MLSYDYRIEEFPKTLQFSDDILQLIGILIVFFHERNKTN